MNLLTIGAWALRNRRLIGIAAAVLAGLVLVAGWTWWHRSNAADDAVREAAEDSREVLDGIKLEMEGARRDVDAANDDDVHECARSRGLFCDALGRGR